MSRWLAMFFLSAVVVVVGAALAGDPPSPEAGHMVFDRWCSPCHSGAVSFMGKNSLPGTLALQLKYNGQKPALLEERTDLSPELIKYVVRHGVQAMPNFRKTEISDAEMDEIAAYLTRNNK